jgi:4,5-DOPA dioxygenase extradiol
MMMPSLFIAHGSPTIVIEKNAYTEKLRSLAGQLPKPTAIVLFSAHWEANVQTVSGVEEYGTIYDFGGFPEEMYRITYPAKGDPALAEEIVGLFQQAGIPARIDTVRGLDHGAWTILKLIYPAADIPVIALSVNPALPNQEQYRIGKALASLKERGILVIGSGGIVHNLWRVMMSMRAGAADQADAWAVEFDDWIKERLEKWDLDALFHYERLAPYAQEAVPANEHFIPLLIAMGAGDDARKAERLYQSYQYGSLSLSIWRFA